MLAQKLCDLGVDVIVGGHPHVVEPLELLTSGVDSRHKTAVIYSLGNAVSNQRRDLMTLNTGHTEDGAVFTVTFEKYADGEVYVADVSSCAAWTKNRNTASSRWKTPGGRNGRACTVWTPPRLPTPQRPTTAP